MKRRLFFFFLLMSINGFSQINWGSGIGNNTFSGGGLTGRINFKDLEYKVQTRFEKKVDEMSYEGDYRKCNNYVDKRVQKGKLSPSELSLVYYIKCRLYSEDIYNDWGFRTDRGNSNIDSMIYPYSDSYPINHADTLIRYSKLLLESTDTSSSIYKMWLGYVYNDMCRTINYGMDTTIENVLKSKQYYTSKIAECEAYLERIHFLKSTVDYFHPVNWLSLDLMEFRFKHSLGLTEKKDEEKIKLLVSDFMLNRLDWEGKRGTALWIPIRSKYRALYGYVNIETELHKLLNQLYASDLSLALQLLKECPVEITNRFAEVNNYDAAWSIDKSSSLSNTRLIDLRESADLDSSTFHIFTTIEIIYDIPKGDTVIINNVLVDSYWVTATLVEPIKITGKGSSSLTIKTSHPIPPDNRVYTIRFSSDDLQLVSNRGLRNLEFEVNIIGQTKE